jgi:hypothetical protein
VAAQLGIIEYRLQRKSKPERTADNQRRRKKRTEKDRLRRIEREREKAAVYRAFRELKLATPNERGLL